MNVNAEIVYARRVSFPTMGEPHVTELLADLKARAGLSMEALAKEMGRKYGSSIQRYFDKSAFTKKYLPLDIAQEFAGALVGKGDPPITEAEVLRLAGVAKATGPLKPRIKAPAKALPMVEVVELDVRAAGGFGTLEESPGETEVARWSMPRELIKGHTTASASALRIITVFGDSQTPDYMPGDRIMVDTADRTPSPPGTFIVWDGMALVVKRIELIPNSSPPTLRLISSNPLYRTYEIPFDQLQIQGRVIGKWQWR